MRITLTVLDSKHKNTAATHIHKHQLLREEEHTPDLDTGDCKRGNLKHWPRDLDYQNSVGAESFRKKSCFSTVSKPATPLTRVNKTAKHKIPVHLSPILISPKQKNHCEVKECTAVVKNFKTETSRQFPTLLLIIRVTLEKQPLPR